MSITLVTKLEGAEVKDLVTCFDDKLNNTPMFTYTKRGAYDIQTKVLTTIDSSSKLALKLSFEPRNELTQTTNNQFGQPLYFQTYQSTDNKSWNNSDCTAAILDKWGYIWAEQTNKQLTKYDRFNPVKKMFQFAINSQTNPHYTNMIKIPEKNLHICASKEGREDGKIIGFSHRRNKVLFMIPAHKELQNFKFSTLFRNPYSIIYQDNMIFQADFIQRSFTQLLFDFKMEKEVKLGNKLDNQIILAYSGQMTIADRFTLKKLQHGTLQHSYYFTPVYYEQLDLYAGNETLSSEYLFNKFNGQDVFEEIFKFKFNMEYCYDVFLIKEENVLYCCNLKGVVLIKLNALKRLLDGNSEMFKIKN